MRDCSLYKVGIVLSVDVKSKSGGKPLKACSVDIGDEDNPITVVTSASNVREGSRLVVAPVGSTIINDEGEEQSITKTSVGGITSEGMFCSSKMLGWGSGSEGIAAQVPQEYTAGDAPPSSKPGTSSDAGNSAGETSAEVQGLFEKKLTKEEKKKLSEERRQAKKAAKEAVKSDES